LYLWISGDRHDLGKPGVGDNVIPKFHIFITLSVHSDYFLAFFINEQL